MFPRRWSLRLFMAGEILVKTRRICLLRPFVRRRAIRLAGGSTGQKGTGPKFRKGGEIRSQSPFTRLLGLAAVGQEKQDQTGYCGDTSVNGPLHLAGHEASGQDVDALKKPDYAEEEQNRAEDVQ